ncbi:hypothetical protein V6x_59830 [Gimesia chilikensis]|uniref:Trypsin-co-occurring domain-containing protein n=1 Tax=Gimesia chilikensis TaxID=2605989 RepID=A0A517WLU0_9PLAN|nr:CU044_2847 family protein [Gimesia chilikensis]QDU06231.1 hypothetical protein V6x_59830 [Gimesia chilikensis]
MTTLLEFPSKYGDVLIAAPTPAGMVKPAGKLEDSIKEIEESFDEVLEVVSVIGKSFRSVIDKAGADSADLELGLQFTAKGSIYVVETEGNASLKIKLTFKPT